MRLRICCIVLVLSIVLAVSGGTHLQRLLGPELLQVHYHSFVWLLVGQHPGKWFRMAVRLDLPYVYIPGAPDDFSSSWAEMPLNDPDSGQPMYTDSVFIGATRLRMPIVRGYPPTSSSAAYDRGAYDGTLGLAPHSIVWRYWDSVGSSGRVLCIGGGGGSCTGDARPIELRTLPLWDTGGAPYTGLTDRASVRGRNCTLAVSPAQSQTELPGFAIDLMIRGGELRARVGDSAEVAVVDTHADLFGPHGSEATRRAAAYGLGDDAARVSVGAVSLRRLAWLYDFTAGTLRVWRARGPVARWVVGEGGSGDALRESAVSLVIALQWVFLASIIAPVIAFVPGGLHGTQTLIERVSLLAPQWPHSEQERAAMAALLEGVSALLVVLSVGHLDVGEASARFLGISLVAARVSIACAIVLTVALAEAARASAHWRPRFSALAAQCSALAAAWIVHVALAELSDMSMVLMGLFALLFQYSCFALLFDAVARPTFLWETRRAHDSEFDSHTLGIALALSVVSCAYISMLVVGSIMRRVWSEHPRMGEIALLMTLIATLLPAMHYTLVEQQYPYSVALHVARARRQAPSARE